MLQRLGIVANHCLFHANIALLGCRHQQGYSQQLKAAHFPISLSSNRRLGLYDKPQTTNHSYDSINYQQRIRMFTELPFDRTRQQLLNIATT